MEMKECSIIKRNFKDSLFLSFFSEKNNVLDLYREMHPEDTVSTIDDLSIRTIKRVLVKGYTNDLGFSVGNRFICLVEAQSYYLKSMQIRTFFYLANSYQNYLEDKAYRSTISRRKTFRSGRRTSSAPGAREGFSSYPDSNSNSRF